MNKSNYPEPAISADEAWATMKQLLPTPGNIYADSSVKFKPSNIFFYAATGFLTISIIVYYFLKEKTHQETVLATHYSQNKPLKDTLLNGTTVFLDTYSTVIETIKIDEQKIINIKGNAYFTKTKNTNLLSPIFKIGKINISPLDAAMYLSYDTVKLISSLHIESGSAEVEIAEKKIILNAGESIQYDEKNNILNDKQKIDINLFSYATRTFEFSYTPLKDAILLIEKAYDVPIVLKDNKLNSCYITTRFDNKSITEMIDIMAYTLNFEYYWEEKSKRFLLTGNGCE